MIARMRPRAPQPAMSRRSASPFATPESSRRTAPEIILGRYASVDVAATSAAELPDCSVLPAPPMLRSDDRPAGRMTLSRVG